MTDRPRSMPRDVRTRERLRAAQAAEARAVSAVCSGQNALASACRKRDHAVAAADVTVNKAEHVLAVAQANLVDISGLDRAATLLGLDKAVLRKAAAQNGGTDGGAV